jgi:hypothetical protein
MKQLVAALVIGAGVILAGQTPDGAQAAPSKPAAFNGTWSVRLVTEAGSCDPSYLYTVAVQDGQVRPAAATGAQVSRAACARTARSPSGCRRASPAGEGSGRLQGRLRLGHLAPAAAGLHWPLERLAHHCLG